MTSASALRLVAPLDSFGAADLAVVGGGPAQRIDGASNVLVLDLRERPTGAVARRASGVLEALHDRLGDALTLQDVRSEGSDPAAVQEQATAAAGAHDGPVNKWKLEGKESGPQYEFDIGKSDNPQDGDYEVQVDAKTGEVTQQD